MRNVREAIIQMIKQVIDWMYRRKTAILPLAMIVTVVTVYSLVMPAFTLEKEEAEKQGGIDVPGVEQLNEEQSSEEEPASEEGQAAIEEKASEEDKVPEEKTSQEKEQSSDEKQLITKETELTKKGKDYSVSVTVDKKAAVPEDTELAVNEIKDEEDKDDKDSELPDYDELYKKAKKALQKKIGKTDIKTIKFYDISLVSGDEEVEPSSDVDVKIKSNSIKTDSDDKDYHIIHFGEGEPEVLDSEAKDGEISFTTDGFSVYAVIGDQEPTARMQINFHGYDESGNEKISTMYVKKEDSSDELEIILYDPGVGKLNDGENFRGWTLNEDYSAAQAASAYNKETNPDGAMTIEDIRQWAQDKQPEIVEDPLQIYDFYPMIVKHYTVTYLDRFGVSLDVDSAYMLRDENEAEYTILKTYETNDDDYHFKGWITETEDLVTNPNPEPETVTIKVPSESDPSIYVDKDYNLYKNNTKATITGDVVFEAHAPKGKWLVFHEVEKGATYVAPQFLEEGQRASLPNPSSMYLLGYTFAGWYKGDNQYAEDGTTVIGSTPNYDENHRYNGEPINEKTHVFAKWVPTEWAPYTVIIWKQNLDGTYAYAESIQLYGNVGDNVDSLSIVNNNDADYLSIDGRDRENRRVQRSFRARHTGRTGETHNYENPEYIGFNCARVDQNIVIVPEGNSIVNVYYDRIEYTIKIYHARRSGNNYNVPTTRSNNTTLSLGGMNWTGTINYHQNDNGTWSNGYQGPPSGVQTETDGNTTYYYTTITAKYGANISDQWPKYEDYASLDNNNDHNPHYTFVSWYMMNDAAGYRGNGSGLDTFKGVISKMDEKLLGDITSADPDDNYLIGRYDDRTINIYTYEIWKEALLDDDGNPIIPAGKRSKVGTDGRTYYLDESIQANSNAAPSGTQAPDYIGYEHIASMDVKPALVNNRATIQFHYHRVVNPIVYRDGSYFDGNGNQLTAYSPTGEDVESDPIPYESDITSYNRGGDNYKTDYPSSYDGFVFEGWYVDADCTMPYTFNKMPDSSITVYAKFRQVQYRVFLHPQVPANKNVYWGSDQQQMNFRVSWGGHIDSPEGVLVVDPEQPDVIDDSYEFAGWYFDPACKQPFDDDAFALNDDIAKPYDKSTEMTDVMDEYGEIISGPDDTFNSDDVNNRWWITHKVDLYGKWIKKTDPGAGIKVLYDPNGGSGEVKDDTLYKPETNAVAQSAPVTPPTTTIDGQEVNRVFLYWVLQKWNPEGGDDGQGAYEDIEPLNFVTPGEMFQVSANNARAVTTIDPDTGEEVTQYFVQLRAEYTDPEKETPTHIWWYSNFGDNDVEKKNRRESAPEQEVEDILINEAVFIKPQDTFTRPGYTFLGWARVPSTDEQGNPIPGHPKLYDLGEDDLFLKYVEAEGSTAAHYEAKNSQGEWVTVTKVAADEKAPYHDMFAVWKKLYKVTVKKLVVGSLIDQQIPFGFKAEIVDDITEETSDEKIFTLKHGEEEEVYSDLPKNTNFAITETPNTDFSISVTGKYTDDHGEEHEITGLENGSKVKLHGDTTITFTNTKIVKKVKILKVDDSATPAPLANAEFTINGETLTSGADGYTDIVELSVQNTPYDLTETVTPEGYEGLTSAVPVTVSADGVTIPSTYDKAKVSGPDSDGVYTITVKNVHKAIPIRVIKTDQNGDPLEDAVFTFAPGSKTFGDGTSPMVSKIPAGGTEAIIVEDNEVPLGTYLIQEDEAPAGYMPLEGGIEIKVEPEDGDIKLTVKIGDKELDTNHIRRDTETGLRTIEIQNTAGVELPVTGGIGTTILYIAGAILTMISGILLVIRAKQKLN